ncbi:MAG: hypothetical protein VYD57_14985 [Pseudomonadota bacterium]|nr:hypothetical protein [Pseudomonadota bacterium]
MRASIASMTGFFSAMGNISHGMESYIETKNFIVAEADRDVVSLLTQIRLPWLDAEGVERFHVFDLVKVLRSGVRIFEAVKPKALQEPSGIHDVIAAFRTQYRDPRMLFRVVDEDMLPHWRVANALLTLKALRTPDPKADDGLFEVVADADEPITVEEAGRRAGLGDRTLEAAAPLLRTGEIALRGDPELTHRSAIELAER